MAQSGPVKILGVDPGLNVTGYGVIIAEGSSHMAVDWGAIRPPSEAPIEERLLRLHEGLLEVIDEHKPREVAVEDFITGYARSSVAVGEARAAVSLAAARSALGVTFYKPSEVKQFVTSYGRGSKDQVAQMVQALLGLAEPPEPADAADALAVAVCHALKRCGDALLAASAERAGGAHGRRMRR